MPSQDQTATPHPPTGSLISGSLAADRVRAAQSAGVHEAVELPGRRRRPGRRDPPRVQGQEEPAVPARAVWGLPGAVRDPGQVVAAVRAGRGLVLARGAPLRRDHRDVVACDRDRHSHRLLQRPIRGLHPPRQTPGPERARVSQRPPSAPRHPLDLYSSTSTSINSPHPEARPTSMRPDWSPGPAQVSTRVRRPEAWQMMWSWIRAHPHMRAMLACWPVEPRSFYELAGTTEMP